jgi:phospholipid-translocating ATPase
MRKRVSIMDRFHKRAEARDEKRRSTAANSTTGAPPDPLPEHPGNRKVYVNVPLPESERDEDGHPMANYPRNKVRTAKYTPITFVPKNLWFQFQNIANIYFLFIIILSVS